MNPALRRTVRRRARGRCEYCQTPLRFEPNSGHIDHIVAKQHGGKTRSDNLALSCSRCNAHKGPNLAGIDPLSGARVDLFHPRAQAWRDHFRLRDAEIDGLTPCGRATVRTLGMNVPERVRLRARLILEGLFNAFLHRR